MELWSFPNLEADYSFKKKSELPFQQQKEAKIKYLVSAGFAPGRIRLHLDRTSDQVLKTYLSFTKKNNNIVLMMKQNHTKLVYFSFLTCDDHFSLSSITVVQICIISYILHIFLFFNPLMVTGELEVVSFE